MFYFYYFNISNYNHQDFSHTRNISFILKAVDHDILSFVLQINKAETRKIKRLAPGYRAGGKGTTRTKVSGSMPFPLIILPFCFHLTLYYSPRPEQEAANVFASQAGFQEPGPKPSPCQVPHLGTAENELAAHTHLGPITTNEEVRKSRLQ